MKVKIFVLTLLVVGFTLGLATSSNAVLTIVENKDLTLTVAAGDSVAVQSVYVNADAVDDELTGLTLDGSAATVTAGMITNISIYEDIDMNGLYGADDVLVGDVTGSSVTVTTWLTGPIAIDITNVTFTAVNQKKYYIIVATVKDAIAALDGKIIDTSVLTVGTTGVTDAAVTQPPEITIVATHLQWITAGIGNLISLSGTTILAADGAELLRAVDDYGNKDIDFVEGVTLSAEDVFTGADLSANLTAKGYAGGAGNKDAKTVPILMKASIAGDGSIETKASGAADGEIESIIYDDVSATASTAVTLVATSATNKLEGSITITASLVDIASGSNVLRISVADAGGGNPLTGTATLTVGKYTFSELKTEVETQVDAAVLYTFSVVGIDLIYSAVTQKFTFDLDPVTAEMAVLDVVTDIASTAAPTFGFTTGVVAAGDDEADVAAVFQDPPAITGIAATRGVELYDTNHNGYLDHATLIFNTPTAGSPNETFFTATGYTVIDVEGQNFDAGGVGIRNVGDYGYTIVLTEKTSYDTDAKPEVQYTGNTLTDKVATPNNVSTVNTAQAVEVDRARPVLLSAVTQDEGIGIGFAANGRLDGLLLTFSEPVANFTAGADSVGNGLYIDPTAGLSFNQGDGALDGSELTIPIGETIINTGATPTVFYNLGVPVTDNATSATGATSPNTIFPDKNDYSLESSFATTDGAPMVVYQVLTKDTGGVAGRIDEIWVTFSENPIMPGTSDDYAGVGFYSDVSAFSSGISANGTYTVDNAALAGGTGATREFKIEEVTVVDVYDTEATPNFEYNPDAEKSDIKDAAGNELEAYGPSGLQHAATVDGAIGVVVKMITRDAYTDTTFLGGKNFFAEGANGRIDGVELVLSEMMKTDDGAENGGTALDNVINKLMFKHADTEERAQMTTGSSLGKPSWLDENINGDTRSTIAFFFLEMPHDAAAMENKGDTGLTSHTLAVTDLADDDQLKDVGNTDNVWDETVLNSVLVDGAAPFLVDGIGKYWGDNAFSTVATNDSLKAIADNDLRDTANGDGYIEGFELKFSEDVWCAYPTGSDSLEAFSVDLPGDGALTFKKGTMSAAGASIVYLYGIPDFDGDPDTDATPTLTFDGELLVHDGGDANYDKATDNLLAEFETKLSSDGADPVIVAVNGGSAQNLLDIKFSEPVYGHYTEGETAKVDSLNKASSSLFGYENLSTGVGATGFTTAYVVVGDTPNVLVATLNANLTAADIESDLVWVRILNTLYDDADAAESGLTDNVVFGSITGSNIKVQIFDDVVAPWIYAAKTLDIDGDGLIDYIRIGLSEEIDDSSIKGYVSQDAMSDDVSATWKVSGYSGTAKWNFFRGSGTTAVTDSGRVAAAGAGKPAFTDNGEDDKFLYLELEEALVPVYSATGLGSTGFAPTITWGTAADAVSLSDFRPNVLNTAADPDDTEPEAVNGTVSDAVGPVIILADYAAPAAKVAKSTGGTVTLYFSEAVVLADADTDLNTDDFYYSGDHATDLEKKYIWGNEWINAGTLELTFKSNHSFAVSSAPQIQLLGTQFEDAEENIGLAKGATLGLTAGSERADWFKAISPMNVPPYEEQTAKTLGGKTIAGLAWLDFNKFVYSTSPATAGEPMDILWTYANVENVDLYISYNGNDWRLVEGSTTPAADKEMSWTPQLNVTDIKLQDADDTTINSGTIDISIISDFNANNGGATLGAPSSLVMTDMPNDNGAFLIAQFGVSADHLTAANSYQFYREYALDAADPNDLTEVLWAVVAAGVVDDANVQSVIVPTIDNTESNWTVRASTGSVISDRAAKEAGDAVATVVFGAAEKAASGGFDLSAASDVAVGAAIDNITPSALDDFAVGSGAVGIQVGWTAPEDHGIVGSYEIFGATQYIHGVDAYEVYRRIKGEDEFVLVGSAVPGSEFYNDVMEPGAAVYQYFVKAVDGNPDHIVETDVRSGIAATELSGDFSGDAIVDASDFSIFAANYGAVNEGNEAGYVWAYDLNADGVVDASDFSIFAAGYGATLKLAKAAALEMPTSDIPFAMGATIDESTSTYFLNVNIGETETLKGFEFYLSYNTEALEFVENSVNGLVGLNMMSVDEDGIIRVSDWFAGEQFDGTVTLAFRSTGVNSNLTFEILNAMVDDVDGLALSTNVSDYEARALPTVYALSQNYPNPFNPTTTIDYSIPKSGNVELVIFNMTGQKVRTLISGKQDAAFYKIVWDGRNELGENVASGLYFYRLISGSFSKIEKMTLIK